ncbi:hypothetical protein NMY22_g17694 [Coprinellus aureogranulatus]|nr:hypothetical protein NMY22_g17694 [Coprinellus aureogranulatus]
MSQPTPNTVPSKRTRRASFRLTDPDNEADPELSSHRAARVQTQQGSQAVNAGATPSLTRTPTRTSTRSGSVTCEDADDEDAELSSASNAGAPKRKKRRTTKKKNANASSDVDNGDETAAPEPAPANSSTDSLPGLVSDTDSEEEAPAPKHKPTEDIDAFFDKAAKRGPKGGSKIFRKCRICMNDKFIVNETTTLRRHIQSAHRKRYVKWCERHDFQSKLPNDIKARKAAAEAAATQGTLDGHVQVLDDDTKFIKYSDALFQEAAEEWMISTNQPLDALSHPKFHHMIDVASRASNGVKIPEKRATRENIIRRFKKNVAELTEKFNSDQVKGDISLTCDAWQAENRDAYFGVTGHWIEEVTPTDWRLRSGLLGFTQMNTAHDGARLGRALYDIAKRYKITHKIGWITCDNASNNTTMLKWFEEKINKNPRRVRSRVGKWQRQSRHIRCLAHIINLATQAVIGTYSSTPHINTESTTADLDSTLSDLADVSMHVTRDEVGLVRLLAVKARSSAKRTQLLKDLQSQSGVKIPLNLILDMRVRWSSTFAMLKRAYDLRDVINDFVWKMSNEESTPEKQRTMRELCVTQDEWNRVEEFLKILKVRTLSRTPRSLTDHGCPLFIAHPCHPFISVVRKRPCHPFTLTSSAHNSVSQRRCVCRTPTRSPHSILLPACRTQPCQLQHADAAQHSFSSQTEPALSHALPALERLHKTWTALGSKSKYTRYHDALNAGVSKIATYYNKTTSVLAYNMAMVLDPALKTSYFQKNWAAGIELSSRTQAEKVFRERWELLNAASTSTAPTASRPLAATTSKSALDLDISDDEDTPSPAPTPTPTPAASGTDKPWLKEFKRYVDGEDELEAGQSVVAWWGVHSRRLPTWASLARDYLAIMASSVSSERAFSAAGITISKRRNSLKADIVEALQVLKSLINSDLIFREHDATPDWEFDNEVEEEDGDPQWEDVEVSDGEEVVI